MPTSKSFITQRNRRMSGTAHGSRSSVCANHRLVGCRIHTAQLSINHWIGEGDFHLSAFMVYSDFVSAGARDSPMGGIEQVGFRTRFRQSTWRVHKEMLPSNRDQYSHLRYVMKSMKWILKKQLKGLL